MRGEILELAPEPRPEGRIGAGDSECVRLGPRLFVHLIQATPDEGTFPIGRLLAYDIELLDDGVGSGSRLRDLGLLGGSDTLAYGDLPLPTFFVREKASSLNFLHGSCRLLHGKGEDALGAADWVNARHAQDLASRPSALYLTGDQIYGDEVAGPLIGHLGYLGCELMGEGDAMSVPGTPTLSELGIYGRQDLAEESKLTSSKAGNHLMSFGEFAAMYLVAWNAANWPAAFQPASEAIPSSRRVPSPKVIRQRRRYASEAKGLERARTALPVVRRVLANTPTYMIFDDHDVTDDWNLSSAWRQKVYESRTGRRIVANALAAFWAFQGWGNDPDLYDASFKHSVSRWLTPSGEVDVAAFEETLWSFGRWSFHVPTEPPTIFLDTRTQRHYDNPEGAARLMGKAGRDATLAALKRAGHQAGQPLILISPVPIYGLELQERRQKFLKDKVGPYEIDLEAWHSNLQGLVDFMRFLIEDLQLPYAIFISGDVHYGMNLKVTFSLGDKRLLITQLVSSSQKHSGVLSKTALNLLGRMVRRAHERLGWDRPPKSARATEVKRRLVLRPANTDEWSEDAPVFLAPSRAERLRVREPPDYREQREYVPVFGPRTLKIIGDNNMGLVSIDGHAIVHKLLCPTDKDVCVYTAWMKLGTSTKAQVIES